MRATLALDELNVPQLPEIPEYWWLITKLWAAPLFLNKKLNVLVFVLAILFTAGSIIYIYAILSNVN